MHVPFYRHGLDERLATSVAAVLGSDFLSTGNVCRQVEELLRHYFGVKVAALTNSWTNGTLGAMIGLGVGPGDEIILPAMTFVACANMVELTGARPVFVDVDPATLLINFASVARAITPRTRVVMPVHLYGQMCDMATLRKVVKSRREDIILLEDCAHAFESKFDRDRPGKYSDLAIFSFYATKNVTCGEGGAIITNDPKLMERIRPALVHGMSAGAADRFSGGFYRHWDVERLGVKANLPDLLAALLPSQIGEVDQTRETREALVARYRERLTDTLRFAEVPPRATSAHHLFPVHVRPDLRDTLLHELNAAGIGTTVNYRSIARLAYYKTKYDLDRCDLRVSNEWGDGVITLPLFPKLSYEEQDYVAVTLNRLVAREVKARTPPPPGSAGAASLPD
jgi:UDP-4-amino-4-deoxy-L-arabinose-oxoglutarate aminotransferase